MLFTDLQYTYENNELTINTWKPIIKIQNMFPASVKRGDTEILKSPVRLLATFDGKTEDWFDHTGYLRETSGEKIEYFGQAMADNVRLNARVRVENDGLMWYDMMLLPQTSWGRCRSKGNDKGLTKPQMRPRIDSLTLEIPVSADLAELYHFWPLSQAHSTTNSGTLPDEGLVLPFKPILWLGNEEAGMTFYTESDENWRWKEKDHVITIDREGDAVVIRVHLLEGLPEIWEKQLQEGHRATSPIKFSFGFQATPVKDYEKKAGFERCYNTDWMKDGIQDEQGLEEILKVASASGAKWYCFMEGWSELQNYDMPADADWVRKVVKKVHEKGLRTIPYFGYEMSSAAPEFIDNMEAYLLKNNDGNYETCWHRDPHQVEYRVCYKGGYRQILLDHCIHVMDDYGFDGVYLDGTYVPEPCSNAAHGCGYTDLAGKRHITYPLLANRDLAKNIYKEVYEKRGGIVEVHQSSCCTPMLLAYCDSYFDGEHVKINPGENLSNAIDRGAMRAEFTGLNWGVPIQFCLTEGLITENVEDCHGLLMLYGVDIKAYEGYGEVARLKTLSKYWNIMDKFDTNNCVFYPYWRGDCPVTVSGTEMYCSAWVKEDQILVLAVNLGEEPVETEICSEYIMEDVILYDTEGQGAKFTAKPLQPYFAEIKLGGM